MKRKPGLRYDHIVTYLFAHFFKSLWYRNTVTHIFNQKRQSVHYLIYGVSLYHHYSHSLILFLTFSVGSSQGKRTTYGRDEKVDDGERKRERVIR